MERELEREIARSKFELAADRCMRHWSGANGGTIWVLAAMLLTFPSYALADDASGGGTSAWQIGLGVLIVVIVLAATSGAGGGGGGDSSGSCSCCGG